MTRIAIKPERRMARALHLQHAVEIHRPRSEVFTFLTHRVPELYAQLAHGHECFRVIGGGPVRPGVVVDCRERADNQVVHHSYQVRAFEQDRHMYLASLPTRTWIHLKHRTIADTADTHVYDDLTDGAGGTLLDVSIVIQLRSWFTKCMAQITGGTGVWRRHQREEMAHLKRLIEQSSAAECRQPMAD